jgi:hypothetical protein
MYIFKIKDNSAALDVAILRTLFLATAIASLFFNNSSSLLIRYVPAMVLLIVCFFTKVFLVTRKISKYLLLIIGSVLLFIAVHSASAVILFFITGMLPGLFYKSPLVEAGNDAVILKRMIGSNNYKWNDFNNVVLKDNLLTLDFKNNKVLQLETEESTSIDEKVFNTFCAGKIMQ